MKKKECMALTWILYGSIISNVSVSGEKIKNA